MESTDLHEKIENPMSEAERFEKVGKAAALMTDAVLLGSGYIFGNELRSAVFPVMVGPTLGMIAQQGEGVLDATIEQLEKWAA